MIYGRTWITLNAYKNRPTERAGLITFITHKEPITTLFIYRCLMVLNDEPPGLCNSLFYLLLGSLWGPEPDKKTCA